MPNLKTGRNCCGCTACESICPREAITMYADDLGFLYPKFDSTKCVECGLCERVCAFNDSYDVSENFSDPIFRGARLKDEDSLIKSRSGGAFVAFSDWILNNGGVIYGAGYCDHFEVAHKRAVSKKERDELRGSKYTQSDMRGVFPQVKRDLSSGLSVLFSGTPCQTSALRSYLPKTIQDKLWTIDLVCHGVPSPKLWSDTIEYVERENDSKVIGVSFRDKRFGWSTHYESFTFENGVFIGADMYTYLFYSKYFNRESCGICHFCNTRRPSDITIADFWGWENTGNRINEDDKGLSLVMINSEKGRALFDAAKEDLIWFETQADKCRQPNLIHCTPLYPQREKVRKYYLINGFKKTIYRYGNAGWRYKLRNKMKGERIFSLKFGRRVVRSLYYRSKNLFKK